MVNCMAASLLLSLSILPFTAGCGGSANVKVTEVAKSKPGLNGGIAFPIPENQGHAELVVERAKPGQPVVVAIYLLDETATKPNPKSATSIKANFLLPIDAEPQAVSFSAKPKTGGKPTVGQRFASAPGPFDFDELKGEILITIEGKDYTVPFALR